MPLPVISLTSHLQRNVSKYSQIANFEDVLLSSYENEIRVSLRTDNDERTGKRTKAVEAENLMMGERKDTVRHYVIEADYYGFTYAT